MVSHDRYFLENVATEMAELANLYPGGLFRVKGNYIEFLARKEEFIHAQNRQQQSLENQVRREREWLRRGPKARTSKSKARIDAAGRLMEELAEVAARQQTGTAQIDFSASGRRTKNLLEAHGVEKQLGGRKLIGNLDLLLRPGMRLGLVGANGSGKTTLLQTIVGLHRIDGGTLRCVGAVGSGLRPAIGFAPHDDALQGRLTVVQAQRLRGYDFNQGNLLERMKRYVPAVIPVFMGALRRANNMAMALEARGFGLSITPTSLIEYRIERRDTIALIALTTLGTGYFLIYYTGYAAISAG